MDCVRLLALCISNLGSAVNKPKRGDLSPEFIIITITENLPGLIFFKR